MCSIQVYQGINEDQWGSVGINTLLIRVEDPYIARKSEKSLDMGELTFHAEKTDCSSKPVCMLMAIYF